MSAKTKRIGLADGIVEFCLGLVEGVIDFVGLASFVVIIGACARVPAKTVIDTAGNVCQVVVAAVDPSLGPICTTAQAIADAIAALLAEHQAMGVTGAAPSQGEIYNWLVAHGATPVKS